MRCVGPAGPQTAMALDRLHNKYSVHIYEMLTTASSRQTPKAEPLNAIHGSNGDVFNRAKVPVSLVWDRAELM